MLDILGTEIKIGDTVVFAKGQRHALYTGTITDINPKTVTVSFKEPRAQWDGEKYAPNEIILSVYRAPENVVVKQ